MTIKITEKKRQGRKPVWRVSIHPKLADGKTERKEYNRPRSLSRRAVSRWAKTKHADLLRERAVKEEVKDDNIKEITFAEYAEHFLKTYAHQKGLKLR